MLLAKKKIATQLVRLTQKQQNEKKEREKEQGKDSKIEKDSNAINNQKLNVRSTNINSETVAKKALVQDEKVDQKTSSKHRLRIEESSQVKSESDDDTGELKSISANRKASVPDKLKPQQLQQSSKEKEKEKDRDKKPSVNCTSANSDSSSAILKDVNRDKNKEAKVKDNEKNINNEKDKEVRDVKDRDEKDAANKDRDKLKKSNLPIIESSSGSKSKILRKTVITDKDDEDSDVLNHASDNATSKAVNDTQKDSSAVIDTTDAKANASSTKDNKKGESDRRNKHMDETRSHDRTAKSESELEQPYVSSSASSSSVSDKSNEPVSTSNDEPLPLTHVDLVDTTCSVSHPAHEANETSGATDTLIVAESISSASSSSSRDAAEGFTAADESSNKAVSSDQPGNAQDIQSGSSLALSAPDDTVSVFAVAAVNADDIAVKSMLYELTQQVDTKLNSELQTNSDAVDIAVDTMDDDIHVAEGADVAAYGEGGAGECIRVITAFALIESSTAGDAVLDAQNCNNDLSAALPPSRAELARDNVAMATTDDDIKADDAKSFIVDAFVKSESLLTACAVETGSSIENNDVVVEKVIEESPDEQSILVTAEKDVADDDPASLVADRDDLNEPFLAGKGDKKRKKKRSSNSECINLDLLDTGLAMDLQQQQQQSGESSARDLFALAEPSSRQGIRDLSDLNIPANRYQSHRAAAVLAKTKLSTPRQGRGPGSARERPNATEKDKDGNKKQLTASGRHAAVGSPTSVSSDPWQWVCCDGCGKWRKLPLHVNLDELPEQWFCSMNIWDTVQNHCDYPEPDNETKTVAVSKKSNRDRSDSQHREADDDDDDDASDNDSHVSDNTSSKSYSVKRNLTTETNEETAAASSYHLDGERGGRSHKRTGGGNRWSNQKVKKAITIHRSEKHGNNGNLTVAEDVNDFDNEAETAAAAAVEEYERTGQPSSLSNKRRVGNASGARSGQQSSQRNQQQGGFASAVAATVNWVQCNKCKKWRKVPPSINMNDLSDVWFCIQNTWAPAYAKCNAREESDKSTDSAPSAPPAAAAFNTSAPPTASFSVPNAPVPGAKKVTQWVQCERKNCKKWRKLPGHVDMSALPEKWYCEMNKWDTDRASCDGPEESDSETEQGKGSSSAAGSSRNQLILANSKGPGTLSYRRIIFGTDGKIRPVFSEKNKNSYGLFSHTEVNRESSRSSGGNASKDEDYVEPIRRISYWWSDCYRHQYYDSVAGCTTAAPANGDLSDREETAAVGGGSMSSGLKAPTFMLDVFKRHRLKQTVSGAVNVPISHDDDDNNLTSSSKCSDVLQLTMYERMNLECVTLRSVLVSFKAFCAVSGPFAAFSGSKGVTLTQLLAATKEAQFADAKVEACRREIVTLRHVIDIVHRLQEQGEVDVTITNAGEVSLVANEKLSYVKESLPPIPSWMLRGGLPLKLRKTRLEVN